MQVKPGEPQNNQADPLPATGPASPDGKGSTSNQTPKTFTDSDVQKAVSDALAKAGREKSEIVKERDAATGKLAVIEGQLSAFTEQKAALEARIDDLAASDPDKKKLVAKLRQLEATEAGLTLRQQKLQADEAAHADRIKKAGEWERKANADEIAGAYDGGDAKKLLTAAEKLNLTAKEQLDALASTFWTKKAAPDVNVTTTAHGFTADSGATNGGQDAVKKAKADFVANPHDPTAWANYNKYVLKRT